MQSAIRPLDRARALYRGHGADGLTSWAPPERPPVRPLVALPRQKPTVILTQISWRARSRGSVAQPGRRRRSIRAALLAAILAGWLRLGRAGVNHGAVVRTAAFFGTGQPFLSEDRLAVSQHLTSRGGRSRCSSPRCSSLAVPHVLGSIREAPCCIRRERRWRAAHRPVHPAAAARGDGCCWYRYGSGEHDICYCHAGTRQLRAVAS